MAKKIKSVPLAPPCKIPCPKCGCNDIYRRHFFPKDEVGACSQHSKRLPSNFVNQEDGYWIAYKECIVHHCRTCQYEWDGPILNKELSDKEVTKAILLLDSAPTLGNTL